MAAALACQRPGLGAKRTLDPAAAKAAGLEVTDVVVGTGAEAAVGRTVSVHYTGTLTGGQKFDSSRERGQPIDFELGRGVVIAGWDAGLVGMRVGGKRRLVVPPALGYGDRSPSANIPAGSTLVFEVELVGVK